MYFLIAGSLFVGMISVVSVDCAEVVAGRSGVRKEVFVFSTSNANYQLYNWSKITTFIQSGYNDDDLVKHAHKYNVTVGYIGNFEKSILTNASLIDQWVSDQVKYIQQHNLDAINVDFEDEIWYDEVAARDGLTSLVQKLTTRVKSVVRPSIQVSMDFAWSPDCIDRRCYYYYALADIVDFAFVMAYDTRSQIHWDCIAWANSPYNTTVSGLRRFQDLYVPEYKLILGIPWYGYNYKCINYDKAENKCYIKSVPFRGSPCSDAAGTQQGYSHLMHLMKTSSTGRLWDSEAQSPYFTYQESDGSTHQVWFDDVASLSLKYRLADGFRLAGVGMWEADSLDYTNTPEMRKYLSDMWDTLP